MLRNEMAEAEGEATATMKCLIVDDHPVVRQGIRVAAREGASRRRGHRRADRRRPPSTATATRSPTSPSSTRAARGGEVEEVVGLLRKRLRCAIVVFTSNGGARLLAEALKAGVKGYVRKDSPPEDLVRAIRAAREGNFYVDPALSSTIVLEEGDRTLTVRQREILQMLADGMQTEAVARKLGLSTETVRTHTKRILAKLHADTRTQAVAIAIRNGLIE